MVAVRLLSLAAADENPGVNVIRFLPTRRLAALTALLALASSAGAVSLRHDQPVADYNALALEGRYSATGYLHDAFGQYCTATLVSPTLLLTASHCFDDDADGQVDPGFDPTDAAFGFEANLPNFSQSNISQVAIHPSWVSSGGSAAFDLAILTLTAPINHVVPAKITDADPLGLIGTMIGYGEQGLGNNFPSGVPGANDRLAASNVIDSVQGTIETDFDSPQSSTSTLGSADPLRLEGTTGPGDSGGPLFADFDGVTRLVGVLNGGANATGGDDSEYGDISEWAAIRSAENLGFLAGFGIVPIAVGLQGDYNGDGRVDAADYVVWRDASVLGTDLAADGNEDGAVDQLDYAVWRDAYGNAASATATPEPAAAWLLLVGLLGSPRPRRRP